jgi:hypothetical protein
MVGISCLFTLVSGKVTLFKKNYSIKLNYRAEVGRDNYTDIN